MGKLLSSIDPHTTLVVFTIYSLHGTFFPAIVSLPPTPTIWCPSCTRRTQFPPGLILRRMRIPLGHNCGPLKECEEVGNNMMSFLHFDPTSLLMKLMLRIVSFSVFAAINQALSNFIVGPFGTSCDARVEPFKVAPASHVS